MNDCVFTTIKGQADKCTVIASAKVKGLADPQNVDKTEELRRIALFTQLWYDVSKSVKACKNGLGPNCMQITIN